LNIAEARFNDEIAHARIKRQFNVVVAKQPEACPAYPKGEPPSFNWLRPGNGLGARDF
jgi:hypothetical protein